MIGSPGLGFGLRPGFPFIFGVVSSGLVPASLPSLLHLRTLLLEQLATSRAGDGSAPGQKQRASGLKALARELNPHAYIHWYSSFFSRKHKNKGNMLSVTGLLSADTIMPF